MGLSLRRHQVKANKPATAPQQIFDVSVGDAIFSLIVWSCAGSRAYFCVLFKNELNFRFKSMCMCFANVYIII